MLLAKLNTGQIVGVLRYGVSTAFVPSRHDWVLVFSPYDARPRRRNLKWVTTTHIVWLYDFEEQT